jgi:hypothetical protein
MYKHNKFKLRSVIHVRTNLPKVVLFYTFQVLLWCLPQAIRECLQLQMLQRNVTGHGKAVHGWHGRQCSWMLTLCILPYPSPTFSRITSPKHLPLVRVVTWSTLVACLCTEWLDHWGGTHSKKLWWGTVTAWGSCKGCWSMILLFLAFIKLSLDVCSKWQRAWWSYLGRQTHRS